MDDDPPALGIHFLTGEHLKDLLWLVHQGGHPEVVYMEMYAASAHVSEEELTEGDDD